MPQIRYNWGICTNRDMDGNGTPCPKCASKEKIKILASHEFVCPECGERLQKVQAPKTFMEKYAGLLIGLGLLIAAGVIALVVVLSGGDNKNKTHKSEPQTEQQAKTATQQKPAPAHDKFAATEENNKPTPGLQASSASSTSSPASKPSPAVKVEKTTTKVPSTANYGRVNLGYGTYVGDLKNGRPHGHGIITYTSSHKIVSSKDFVASPGDTYEGEFRDGRPASIGIWKHDGETTGVKP